jgi:hypothetical protein
MRGESKQMVDESHSDEEREPLLVAGEEADHQTRGLTNERLG